MTTIEYFIPLPFFDIIGKKIIIDYIGCPHSKIKWESGKSYF